MREVARISPLRNIFAIGLCTFFIGCASLPDHVSFDTKAIEQPSLHFVDDRPMNERISHYSTESGNRLYFGDDYFSPTMLQILQTRLNKELGQQFSQRTIRIMATEIRMFSSGAQVAPHELSVATSPQDAAAQGLARVLISFLPSPRERLVFSTYFAVDVDNKEFSSLRTRDVSRWSYAQDIEKLIDETIELLITKINDGMHL